MTAPMCYATDGLIVPAMIPCNGLNAENITSSATAFRTQGGLVRTNASTVATAWTGLGPHYVAPESATLLDVMTPVSTESDVFAGKMESVAGILDDFAAEVDPIQKALEGLKVEAEAFVSDVQAGVWVEPSNPDHPQYSAYISQYSTYGGGSYSGSWNAYGATEPTSFSGTTISWRDHGPSVDRNRELIHAVADQYAKLDAAQVGAANRILALMDNSCGVPLEAVEAWQLKQDGVELPWGTAVEKNRDCGESFGHGMGEAFVGMGEGIGSLFGYNPQTGEWGDGEWAGQAWRGLGMTLAGVATFGPLTLAMRFGPEGTVPRPVRDFITESQDYALNALKGIVAWDTWSENPSEAAGTALVNIGTFFIPGAGTVGGILKAGGAGARVASIAGAVAKGADVVVPGGSFVVKALAEGTLAATLRFGRGLDDMIDVSSLTKADDALHANPGSLLGHTGDDLLGQLDRAGGDAPGGLPGHTSNFELTGGSPVDLPAGFEGPGGHVDGAAPDGSGVGGHVDSSVGGDAVPPAGSHDTAGAGGPPRRDPSQLIDASPEGQSIIAGTDPSGPGWTRVSDGHRAEPNYGQPIQGAGQMDPQYLPAVDANNVATNPGRAALLLRLDPNEPFGHNGFNGPTHDSASWQAHNVDPAQPPYRYGSMHWAPNDGAVVGTRVEFHDLAEFRRIFGNLPIDRLGEQRGTYLGIGGGTFAERGLPPGQVGQKHFWDVTWLDNVTLPPDWRIEISLIADAYGRPGGGLQMLVTRPDPMRPGERKGVPLQDLDGKLFTVEDWFAQ